MKLPWLLCGVLAASVSTAEAQGIAATFQELRLLVRPGDTVMVTDTAGREVRGRIAELSPPALTLTIDGARRDLMEADVATIRHRRGDPLGNGALWGFGIGAGLVAIGVALACDGCGGEEAGYILLGAALYGGMGAGIGVGVDALITRPHVIYERRPVSGARLGISPILTAGRKGALVSFGF
jgi:hypothetical protein